MAGNQVNHQNFNPSLIPEKLGPIFMGMKQKKSKMADSKKLSFTKSPIFLLKFHGLVLGSIGLIDVKGNDVAQPIWPCFLSGLLSNIQYLLRDL